MKVKKKDKGRTQYIIETKEEREALYKRDGRVGLATLNEMIGNLKKDIYWVHDRPFVIRKI